MPRSYTLAIEADDSPDSPREWNEGTSYLWTWLRRHNLGDKKPHGWDADAFGSLEEIREAIERKYKPLAILPVYKYEHGGIMLAAGTASPFTCPWDSGQAGWIFAVEHGGMWAGMTTEAIEAALRSEADLYSRYLNGEVYGFIVRDEDGEVVESCWGFYDEDEARTEGEAMVAALQADEARSEVACAAIMAL